MSAPRRMLVLGALLAFAIAPRAAGGADAEALRRECDYGVTLALEGRVAAAESTFLSLLTHAPGDARAWNNLGNLSLLRGELDTAHGFYERAARADSLDAGILLNDATALLLQGNDDAAEALARQGIALAGGVDLAAGLLGLSPPNGGSEGSKGRGRTTVSRDEVQALLRAAAGRVPAESTSTGAARKPAAPEKGRKRPPTWRPGGARASGGEDASTLVYWKR